MKKLEISQMEGLQGSGLPSHRSCFLAGAGAILLAAQTFGLSSFYWFSSHASDCWNN